MTELDIRLEVGAPTDDTIELEDETPTEVRLWPIYFYRNEESEPILSVEIALEQEEDEDGFFPAYTISTLDEKFEDALGIVLTLSELESGEDEDDEEMAEWIDEDQLAAIENLSDTDRAMYEMTAGLLDYAQAALEEQALQAGAVIRYSELLDELEDDDEE
ncbi:MAG: hypothetical protein H3C43_01010 [Leptonema sp. (in: Bacteria)]|nr:hypothetical protein [Leptonema sp. (in: bacteria)]